MQSQTHVSGHLGEGTESLEGGKSAAVLLGVDYDKVFNRIERSACLSKLRQLGASDGSIAPVRAFLGEERMMITIDG